MNAARENANILIVTALPVESQAVRSLFEEWNSEMGEYGTVYEVASYRKNAIVVLETGAGNVNAAIEVERAIARYDARYLLFVGVAGGLKDVKIGDVVASTKIYGYESGKSGKQFLARPTMGEASYSMVQLARLAERGGWFRTPLDGDAKPRVWVGPIVSGEKVLVSLNASEVKLIRDRYSDALAVEMEGYGVLRVGYSRETVRMIVIRGISDLLEGKTKSDATGSQDMAARHAAKFAFAILAQLFDKSEAIPEDKWQELERALVRLYPLGPKQSEIWSRAGGDLASLDLGQNGKANWHSAVRTLRNGGGGKEISFTTILACILTDYPNSSEAANLT